jgi:hypothetical protein
MRILKILLIFGFSIFMYFDCQSQVKIDFQTENEYKKALHGTWILKSYRDSIEKGKTPAMISSLLTGIHKFYYNPDKKYSNVFPKDSSYYVFIYTMENFLENGYSIQFDLEIDSISVIEKSISSYYDTAEKKWIDKPLISNIIGKLALSTERNDTLMNLTIFDNSGIHKKLLVKYMDYDQLINRQFITGCYYVNNDTTKLVKFLVNGKVSGLENIDMNLSNIDKYFVSVGYFGYNNDNLCFELTGKQSLFQCFYWTKLGDDLLLRKEKTNKYEIDYKLKRLK